MYTVGFTAPSAAITSCVYCVPRRWPQDNPLQFNKYTHKQITLHAICIQITRHDKNNEMFIKIFYVVRSEKY